MNILALGAHPDDVEFLCAGTLFKYRSQGHKIFIVLTTSGNQGSNEYDSREQIAAIREAEQLEAAKLLEAEVRFLRYDDELLLDSLEARRTVINAMRWAKPDVIFTNPPWDPSPDHAETGKIVSKLMLSLPGRNIPADESPVAKKVSLFYWDIPGGIDFLPEVYVDISDVLDRKIEALGAYGTECHPFPHPRSAESLQVHARYWGTSVGMACAEPFQLLRQIR